MHTKFDACRIFMSAIAIIVLTSCFVNADDIDPRGVYFHSYTGPFSAIEWVDFRQRDGVDRYQFSDIRGLAPYEGEIDGDGVITWDDTGSTSGSGLFSTNDDATMTLNYFGGVYQSTLTRAPGTDADFITQIDSRTAGNLAIAGQWELSIQELDASTGALVAESVTNATVGVSGALLQLTYDDGSFFQGVFEEADHAGFRVVLPGLGLPDQFASFDGSETNLELNLLGDLRFDGAQDAFTATFLTQTRNDPGQQQQFVHVINAVRSVPEPASSLMLLAMVPLLVSSSRRQRASMSTM